MSNCRFFGGLLDLQLPFELGCLISLTVLASIKAFLLQRWTQYQALLHLLGNLDRILSLKSVNTIGLRRNLLRSLLQSSQRFVAD
jgi:hypothetical protein